MGKCVFCNIKQEDILLENNNAFAILSKYPFRQGHCVVISKRHITSISELTMEEGNDMTELTITVAKVLEEELNAEKTYQICIGDKENHLHYHLIPKLDGQKSMGVYCFGGLIKQEGEFKYNEGEYENILTRISTKLK